MNREECIKVWQDRLEIISHGTETEKGEIRNQYQSGKNFTWTDEHIISHIGGMVQKIEQRLDNWFDDTQNITKKHNKKLIKDKKADHKLKGYDKV